MGWITFENSRLASTIPCPVEYVNYSSKAMIYSTFLHKILSLLKEIATNSSRKYFFKLNAIIVKLPPFIQNGPLTAISFTPLTHLWTTPPLPELSVIKSGKDFYLSMVTLFWIESPFVVIISRLIGYLMSIRRFILLSLNSVSWPTTTRHSLCRDIKLIKA